MRELKNSSVLCQKVNITVSLAYMKNRTLHESTSAEWTASLPVDASRHCQRSFHSTKRRPSGTFEPILSALWVSFICPIGPHRYMSGMDCIGALGCFAPSPAMPSLHCRRPARNFFDICNLLRKMRIIKHFNPWRLAVSPGKRHTSQCDAVFLHGYVLTTARYRVDLPYLIDTYIIVTHMFCVWKCYYIYRL